MTGLHTERNNKQGICCVLITLTLGLSISNSFASEEFARMLDRVTQVKEQFNIAGLGLAVVDEKSTLHRAYLGFADRERKIPVQGDTVFRVGSITKTFTALALMRLMEQGKTSLDDPVSRYSDKPLFTNTYAKSPIRIAHLLEHTAGFRDMTQKEFAFKQENWSLEQSLAYDPKSRITAWKPGEYFSYSNSGAGVVAWLIERISQQPFEEFVHEHIFRPLQLRDATFFKDEQIKPRLATGYDTDGRTVIPYWHMLYRSFGAANARVEDMAKFVRMLINYGAIESSEPLFLKSSIQRLEVPMTSLAARKGLRFGYGLGNYQWLRDGVLFHGHGGDADGFLARYGYTRENNRGYFVVINAYNNRALRKISRIVESWLVQDIIKRPHMEIYELSRARRARIVGRYSALTNRFAWNGESTSKELKIVANDKELFTQIGDAAARPLLPVSETHFRRPSQPIATISIADDADGIPVAQGDFGNFRKIE